jgi:hypothetical protein
VRLARGLPNSCLTVAFAVGLGALACTGGGRVQQRVKLINAESPTTGPAGVSGSGGTGASGNFGSGGTRGGTSEEGARETPGGPAGRALPRDTPRARDAG